MVGQFMNKVVLNSNQAYAEKSSLFFFQVFFYDASARLYKTTMWNCFSHVSTVHSENRYRMSFNGYVFSTFISQVENIFQGNSRMRQYLHSIAYIPWLYLFLRIASSLLIIICNVENLVKISNSAWRKIKKKIGFCWNIFSVHSLEYLF